MAYTSYINSNFDLNQPNDILPLILGGDSEDGTAQLSMACIYVVVGLALVSMTINLLQETVRNKAVELAMDLGIIDDPSLTEDDE